MEKGQECYFKDIEQHGFFIYEGVMLCKFGRYGFGIDANGKVAKVFNDETIVKFAKV